MAEIRLKTSNRKTTVPRKAIRAAVIAAMEGSPLNKSPKQKTATKVKTASSGKK